MTYSSLIQFHNYATLSSPTDHGYINKHADKSGGKENKEPCTEKESVNIS